MSGIIYLVEITVYDDDLPGTKVLRYSTGRGYTTKPGDTPSNAYFEPRVINPGELRRHVFSARRTTGRSQIGFGVVELVNADGGLDDLRSYGFDGRSIVIRRGEQDAAYPSGFTTMISATMDQVELTLDRVTIHVRDRFAEVASKPLNDVKYTGVTGALAVEGSASDIVGKPKPRTFGTAGFVRPNLVNTAKLVYQLNHDPASGSGGHEEGGLTTIYDQGVPLNLATERSSLTNGSTGLLDVAPSAGDVDYYFGVGGEGVFIRLGSTPAGVVVVQDFRFMSLAKCRVGTIIEKILTLSGGVDPAEIDGDTVDDLDAAFPHKCGFAFYEEATVGEAVDRAAESVQAYWTVRRDGTFFLGQLSDPALGSPVATLTNEDILDVPSGFERFSPADHAKGLPAWRVLYQYAPRTYRSAQADFAGAVGVGARASFSMPYQTEVADDSAVLTKHPLAPEFVVNSIAAYDPFDTTSLTDEAERILDLRKVDRELYQVPVPLTAALQFELGDVVAIQLLRLGLDAGKNFLVLGIAESYASEIAILELWG